MRKRIWTLMLALALLSTVLCGCGDGKGQDTPEARAAEGALNVGIAQDLDDSPDPHKTVKAGTREIMFNVFEGLVKPTTDGDLAPAIAERYEISPDGTTYTFTLREGVKFHNGEPVQMKDVLYSIRRCADDTEGEPLVPAFSAISDLSADGNVLTITLAEPNNEFLSYLTTAILPEGYDGQDTAPIGTGPFKFVSRAAQESIVMERFDDYWGEKPALSRVTFKIIENADSIVMSLQSGAVDLFSHLTTTQIAQLGDDFNVAQGTMNLVQALYLNNKEKPLDDVRVRQALCYAIDREQIIDLAFDGYGAPLGSSMYPAFGKYFDESLTDYYPHDVAKAKALLAEAGYPDGFDLKITAPSNYKPHMDTAEVLVQQLSEAGVRATIVPVEWESWVSDTYVGRNYQSTIVGVDAANMTARSMLERFVSTASNNFTNYNNADYDALFARAIACYDDAEQTAIYREMEKNLTENAANVYIQDLADLIAVRKGLEGVRFYPIYVLDLAGISYVK